MGVPQWHEGDDPVFAETCMGGNIAVMANLLSRIKPAMRLEAVYSVACLE